MLNRSIYIFLSKMTGFVIRLAVPMFLTRLLSTEDYGIYSQFFLIEVLIATLFQLGINQSLYYFVPRDKPNHGSYFATSLILNVVIFSLVFLGLSQFRESLAEATNLVVLTEYYPALIGYTVLLMLVVATDCYLCSMQRIIPSAAFEVGGQLLISTSTVVAAVVTRDLGVILLALVGARVVQFMAMQIYVATRMDTWKNCRPFRNIKAQVKYGVVLGLGGAAWTILPRVHELVVNKALGAEGFAPYAVGIREIPVAQFYLQSLAVVALGQFAVMEKNGDWEGIKKLYREILTGLYAVVIPFIIIFVIIADPLVPLAFSDKYIESIPIFRIHTLGKLAMLWNAQLVLRAMGRNEVTLYLYSSLLVAAFFVLNQCLAWGGLLGVVAGNALLFIFSRLACQFILNRVSGHPMPYVTTPREVMAFYRDSWAQGTSKLRSLGLLPGGKS